MTDDVRKAAEEAANLLLDALAEPAAAEPATGWRKASTRVGQKGVAFYLSPEAYRQLGRLSVDTDRTLQDLMVEAVDELFSKNSLPRIARQ